MFENISHQDLFLLTAYINVDLKYLFLSNLMQISDWRWIETNHRCHIGYRLINVIDVNLGGCHKSTRKFIPIVQTRDLMEILDDGPDFLDCFDAELFGELVDKIIVESNEQIRFRLKNGLELTETMERTMR